MVGSSSSFTGLQKFADKNNLIELTVHRNGTSKGSLLGNVIQSILLGLVEIIEFLDVNVPPQILFVQQGSIVTAGHNTSIVPTAA